MGNVNSNELDFKYNAFGLNIHSLIQILELRISESEKLDITINLGDVNIFPEDILKGGANYKITGSAIYIFGDHIGKFRITKDSIIVDPANDVNKIILRNFLLGTVFATLLRLRGLFILHASSININGSTITFPGFRGY